MFEALLELDMELFKAINHPPYPEVVDGFFKVITWLGSGFVFAPLLLLLGAYIAKRTGSVPVVAAHAVIAALLLGGVLTTTLKWTVGRDRPPVHQNLDARVKGDVLKKRSFPSGHSQSAFSWLLTLALLFSRKGFTIVAVTLAVFVAVSRVVLGVHFPLDVIVGSMIGAASAIFGVHWALKNRRLPDHQDQDRPPKEGLTLPDEEEHPA